jgi:hypothetical protein
MARIKMSHEDRFRQFHDQNPQVYTELVKLARQVKDSGATKFGIRAIWERLRWMAQFEVRELVDDIYRMNDHYTRFYARMIMQQEADLAGFFNVRSRA